MTSEAFDLHAKLSELTARVEALEKLEELAGMRRGPLRSPSKWLSPDAKVAYAKIPSVLDLITLRDVHRDVSNRATFDKSGTSPVWHNARRRLNGDVAVPVPDPLLPEFERFLNFVAPRMPDLKKSVEWPVWVTLYTTLHRDDDRNNQSYPNCFPNFEQYADRFVYLMELKGYRVGMFHVNTTSCISTALQNVEGWEIVIAGYRYGEEPRAQYV